jgi:DNA-binding CsgD family transcriptional regulator
MQKLEAGEYRDNYSGEAARLVGAVVVESLNSTLTPRENEVLLLTARGHRTPEVAGRLFITEHTIKDHRKKILSKTGAKNMASVVNRHISNGDLPVEVGSAPRRLLRERELEVLYLIAEGYSNQSIAECLYLSVHTVKGHIKNILEALNASTREHAVTRGYETGHLILPIGARAAMLPADQLAPQY